MLLPFKIIKDSLSSSLDFILTNPVVVTLYLLFIGSFHFLIPVIADVLTFIYVGSAMFFFMAAKYIGFGHEYMRYTYKNCINKISMLAMFLGVIYLVMYATFIALEHFIPRGAINESEASSGTNYYGAITGFLFNSLIDALYYYYFLCYLFWYSHIKLSPKETVMWTSFNLLRLIPLFFAIASLKLVCILALDNYIKVTFTIVSTFSDIFIAHVFFNIVNLPRKPKKKKAKSKDKAFIRKAALDT